MWPMGLLFKRLSVSASQETPARRGQTFRNDTCNEDEIDSGADLPTSTAKTTIEYENEIDLLKQQNKMQNEEINSLESEILNLKTEKVFAYML